METFSTLYASPLGTLLLECTNEHVTKVKFTTESASSSLPSHPLMSNLCQQLDYYFTGVQTIFDLPLLQPGTLFQQKVWSLLQTIPFGSTLSYLTLAKHYGDVKAIRAVASANGKNNIAVIVPCHRVIGSNATLTGYAGGLWRKQWLLEHEQKFSNETKQLRLDW